ncbi:hypothetical protein G4B88_016983 [Cannabis sativa]|uniref:Aldehyde dehydrogenase n=1 Tax=Cannabis sativa TaxID=3483 RepID=A0A7J6DL32_CANSA|nr:hypothetical protein G4B88_016983 [Cannabis sativa]
MAIDGVEEKMMKEEVFDSTTASFLLKELKQSFASGKTRSYEWRVSQLKSILKFVNDHEQDVVDALRSDLSKPEFEFVIYEVLTQLLESVISKPEFELGF